MLSAKRKYERPVIVKVQTQLADKCGLPGQASVRNIRERIDGVSIDQLTSEFGSPLFVFSEKTIREIYAKAQNAFVSRYPDVQFSWSYKTNYLKSICSLFHKLGSIAEVVSDFEYKKARNLGIEGCDIIFNGPYKPMDALETAAREGARIHIDSFEEINDLEAVAVKLNRKIPVAIRINLDSGIYPQWSRFGFNLETGQAMDAIKRIKAMDKLDVVGLHCHIGTFILDASAYGRAIDKLMQFSRDMNEEAGYDLSYLDLGGGFASKSQLKGVYQAPEIAVPTFDEYAESITAAIKRNCSDRRLPKLYLETGRALIDEAGYLITSVISSKMTVTGNRAYTMDAGVNLLYTSNWYNYTVEIDRKVEGVLEPAALNGPLCMNIDVVEENMMLPRLPRNTRLILSPVGAYNVTQSMQFIHCRPAVVMICEDGHVEVIRQSEEMQDIEINERLPDCLAHDGIGDRPAFRINAS